MRSYRFVSCRVAVRGAHSRVFQTWLADGAGIKLPRRRSKAFVDGSPPVAVGAFARARLWLARRAGRRPPERFQDSAGYWVQRYAVGRTSGAGSAGVLAAFKAEVLNRLVAQRGVPDVIEFGCGDGAQLALASYPAYFGLDVSPDAIARCRARFAGDPGKRFAMLDDYAGEQATLALSVDVIYHLVEDAVFEAYMQRLFGAATALVAIYSSDHDAPPDPQAPHVRHRRFPAWVAAHAPHWRLIAHTPNRYPWRGDVRTGSWSDFHVYGRVDGRGR